ncbi:MAG TPA: BatD family protein [Bacteroidales bacterium]|nr:BatD family protein [Bacteroidales bacterium]
MKSILLVFLIGFISIWGFSQELSFTANGPAKVGLNQSFQVSYMVNAKGSNLTLGDYSDFKFVNGPSTSTSSNTQIINGQVSTSVSYSYTYVFQPQNTGKFTIGGATITVNGKQYTSNSVTIEVQKDPVQTQNNRRNNTYDPFADFYNQTQPQVNNTPKEITNEDLFVRVVTDKTNLYKGEPINAAIKIYTKVDLSGVNEIKFPSFDAFYAEELESATRLNFTRETYNGQTYNVALIRRYILYPRYSGNVTIESCEVDCQVRQAVSGGNNFWAQFYGYYETVQRKIKSPEVNISVKNLPPASDDFSGAIGTFNIKMTQSADTVNINDAVTFKLVLNGTGNFNMIEIPDIVWPKEFEVYEPVSSDNTNVSTAGVSGTKSWEFTVIPRYPGIFKLGKINFQYFDSSTKQYKTISTNDITLAVRKDKNDTKFGDTDYVYSQKSIEYIGDEDIRFIKNNDLNLTKNYTPIITDSFFSFYFILPLTVFILLVIFLRKKIKENADIAMMKVKHAGKVSRKRLKRAKKFMVQNNKTEFYKEIISALWGYAGDRLGIAVADLTKDKVLNVMEAIKTDPTLATKLVEIIDKCEYAHFAPNSKETELSYVYKEAADIIEELEQKLKV